MAVYLGQSDTYQPPVRNGLIKLAGFKTIFTPPIMYPRIKNKSVSLIMTTTNAGSSSYTGIPTVQRPIEGQIYPRGFK